LSSPSDREARRDTGPQGPVLFALAAALIAFAPLIRGGNRPLPLAILECAGIAILALAAWSPSRPILGDLPATLRWGAALLIAVPLLQLVPLPMAWWAMLPGHAPFAQVLETAGEAGGWRPITLHADATQYSWLVLLPCVAVFVAARQLDRTGLRRLAMVFVAVASVEAILGVMQAGSAPGSPITFGNPWGGGGATGTYINKNHFAALIAMALPMLLALWAIEMLPVVTHRGEVLREHPRNADRTFALRAFFSMLAILLIIALLLSRSRAGIAAGLVAFAIAIVALVWRAATVQVKVALVVVAASALALGAYIGLTPALERFAPDAFSMEYRSRMELAAATLKAAIDFLPFGSGLGTFADLFRRYQGGRITGFADHAHNDYAELILELGVAGLAILALLGAAYALRWRSVWRERVSRRLRFMQIAAGLGMLAMILHGLFDFNFHIPANAIFFSLLAGIFFFTPAEDRA
jgi:O-antigen ligase